jgi:site-specific recombinase XerD
MLLGKVKVFLLKHLKRKDIPLEEVKANFISEFENFLRAEYHVKSNTSMKSAKELKQVMRYGVKLEYINRNPFEFFQSTYKPPKREVLTMEEIQILQTKEFSIDRLQEVRDCFIFSCYTGYAYSDVETLSPNDIMKGIDGNLWIMHQRNKTGVQENVPLLPEALQIIERYKSHPYCLRNKKLLPVNSNQRYNAYLKEIADICGIKKKLTTHIARHTFATTICLTNDVPMETTMELLGQTNIRTTQIYGKIIQKKISSDMLKLRNKLSFNSVSKASTN